jgi:DNA polymerase III psi subunit
MIKQPVTPPVAVPKPQPPVSASQPRPVNKSKVMILFFNEQSIYLKRNEEALLQKILAAVHLKLEDVDLVNLNNIRQIDSMDILKDKVLNQLISFGISLTELNLQIHLLKYQLETVEGIKMLLADNLSFLEHDMDAKKQLWKCLKEMFSK